MENKEIEKLLFKKAKNQKIESIDKKRVDEKIEEKIKSNRIKKLKLVAAVIIFTIIFLGGITAIKLFKTSENIVIEAQNTETENSDEIMTILINENTQTEQIYFEEYTVILEVEEIISNTFKNSKPQTIIKAYVINSLNSNLQGTIEFSIDECMLDVSDESIQEYIYDYTIDYSKTTKIRVINNEKMYNIPYPEVSKTYIATLFLSDNEDLSVNIDSKYPFYEYDTQNNLVDINGNLEEFYIDKN